MFTGCAPIVGKWFRVSRLPHPRARFLDRVFGVGVPSRGGYGVDRRPSLHINTAPLILDVRHLKCPPDSTGLWSPLESLLSRVANDSLHGMVYLKVVYRTTFASLSS